MIFPEIHVLSLLASISWSLGEIVECKSWLDQLSAFSDAESFSTAACEYCVTGARLATSEGKLQDARRLISRGMMYPQAQLNSFRMFLLACEIELRRGLGVQLCSESELVELRALHLGARSFGQQDEVVVALWRALVAHGECSDAADLVGSYVSSYRRENFRLPSALQEILGHQVCGSATTA
jgi:hypothetical protein